MYRKGCKKNWLHEGLGDGLQVCLASKDARDGPGRASRKEREGITGRDGKGRGSSHLGAVSRAGTHQSPPRTKLLLRLIDSRTE